VTAVTEPFPPWLRDLNRLFSAEGTVWIEIKGGEETRQLESESR
jgi:hypothetical protein